MVFDCLGSVQASFVASQLVSQWRHTKIRSHIMFDAGDRRTVSIDTVKQNSFRKA
jgi:hypothetical protein